MCARAYGCNSEVAVILESLNSEVPLVIETNLNVHVHVAV